MSRLKHLPALIFQRTPILGALVIVIAANIFLFVFNPLKNIDPEALPTSHGWCWWATKEFQETKQVPDVVIFGSSAMMHPTWLQEAAYRNSDVDLVVDHQCTFLQSVIHKYLPSANPVCFNFALPGCMISDEYMIGKALFKENRKPKLVVIGIHPRDLMDNGFNCAFSSKHYRYLSRFTNTDGLMDLAIPHLWRRITLQIESLLFIKSKNHDIQLIASQPIQQFVQPILTKLPPSTLEKTEDQDRKFASFQDEIVKGVWIAHPTAPYWYVNAPEDCQRRFRKPNDVTFNNQTTWLKMCLEQLNKQNIAVVIVNLPVTQMNRQFMPPGTYERHMNTVRTLAQEHHCAILDLTTKQYSQFDFTDWVHMDASGGEKVLAEIGHFIAADKSVASHLQGGNTQLAKGGANAI